MEMVTSLQGIDPRYKILEKVGSGGMGEVYKARDDRLQRFVAIKILTTTSMSGEKLTLRFLHEARAASALNHPHICTVYDAQQVGTILYLVMEFVDGNTLGALLDQGKAFSVREAAAIGIAICDALAAAHEKGIIHRDIKPDNIMIARDGLVKVMDFGLAKLKQREDQGTGEATLTAQAPDDSVSALRGTAAYMSPEQIECWPVDERTDIFSLGIVLYEMLAGVHPFAGENALARMQSILRDEPRAFERDKKGSGGELQRIILHTLAKRPEDRPPEARALQTDLQQIVQREDNNRIRPRGRRFLSLILPAILLLISIALVIIQHQTRTRLLPAPNLKLYPVTLSAEEEYNPHFAPDDKTIIYFARDDNTLESRFCLKNLTTDLHKNLPLNGYEADWSPNGAELVVSSPSGIFIADTTGRGLRQIALFRGEAEWSPDGSLIAFAGHINYVLSDAICLYSLADHAIQRITPQNGMKFTSPTWSPDGRWLACTAGEGSLWDIWLIEAATGRARPLVQSDAWITEPVWVPSGELLYYLSNKNGIRDIWRVAVDPSRGRLITLPQQLTTGLNIQEMDIASSGKKMIFTRSENKNQIWRISLTHPATDKLLLMTNLNAPESIEVSPDGQNLIVQTYLGGRLCLVRKSLRTMDEQILFSAQPAYSPCWTPDGRWILFDAGGGDNADIWRIPAGGGQAEKLVVSPKADWRPTVSPDGRRLCFVSNRTGQFDLWLQELEGGVAIQLTHTPEMESHGAWSHTGRYLAFYTSPDKEDKFVFNRYDFVEKRFDVLATIDHKGPTAMGKLQWKEDDTALYFMRGYAGAVLYEISPSRKEAKPLLSSREVGLPLRGMGFSLQANTGYFITGDEIRDIYFAEGL